MSDLAAIPYDSGFPIDDFMASIALGLRERGLRLAGVIQRNSEDCGAGCLTMTLEDLATGRRFSISQELGAASEGCRLDPAGLAEAGAAMTTAFAAGADLVIVNKFGRQEALGQGLRAEIAAAVLAGLPLLVPVRGEVLDAWRDFAGDDWVELPAEAGAVDAWLSSRGGAAA